MKNSFKTGLLALTIVVSFSSCDPSKVNSSKNPIDTSKKVIDTTKNAVIDTAKKDTAKKN